MTAEEIMRMAEDRLEAALAAFVGGEDPADILGGPTVEEQWKVADAKDAFHGMPETRRSTDRWLEMMERNWPATPTKKRRRWIPWAARR